MRRFGRRKIAPELNVFRRNWITLFYTLQTDKRLEKDTRLKVIPSHVLGLADPTFEETFDRPFRQKINRIMTNYATHSIDTRRVGRIIDIAIVTLSGAFVYRPRIRMASRYDDDLSFPGRVVKIT